jgi:hypothetical protein
MPQLILRKFPRFSTAKLREMRGLSVNFRGQKDNAFPLRKPSLVICDYDCSEWSSRRNLKLSKFSGCFRMFLKSLIADVPSGSFRLEHQTSAILSQSRTNSLRWHSEVIDWRFLLMLREFLLSPKSISNVSWWPELKASIAHACRFAN